MGRDVAGFRLGKKVGGDDVKLNGNTNGAVHVSRKAVPEIDETKEAEEKWSKKQEMQRGLESTNHETEQKIIRGAEPHKLNDKKSSSPVSGSSVNGGNSFEPLTPVAEAEKQSSYNDDVNQADVINDSSSKPPQLNDFSSPKSVEQKQSTKQLQLGDKKFYDEEDNSSLASSTGTSVRTSKSRITVPVAPRFTVDDRLQKRKEFYTKLEEKHRALEKEKLEYEARIKEEEAAAIKQLRKSLVYKANPVPSFYREGPPPKVELKKLPVTRAISPNLTRRKSLGDAVKATSAEDMGSVRATRHSVGVYREGKISPITAKVKDRSTGVRKLKETSKVKDNPKESQQTTETSHFELAKTGSAAV